MVQVLYDGILRGCLLGLLAAAFNAAYLPTRVFHVALAAIYMLVPYVCLTILNLGLSWPIAAAIAVTVGGLLSGCCETFSHAKLEAREASSQAQAIASLALFIVLSQAIPLFWGTELLHLRQGADRVFRTAYGRLTLAQVASGAVSATVLLGYAMWFRYSTIGLHFRGLAEAPIAMMVLGKNVPRLRRIAFAISGALAGVASLLSALDVGFDTHSGLHTLLLAIVATIVGGQGTFLGPVLGGFLLGILRAGVVWFWSARWQDAVSFLVLVFFLVLRPQGLAGHRQRLEAAE